MSWLCSTSASAIRRHQLSLCCVHHTHTQALMSHAILQCVCVCVCVCVINEKGVPVSQHIVCPVQFIYPVLLSLKDGNLWKPDICGCFMADVISTCLY